MINNLIEFHNSIFFALHHITYVSTDLNYWIHIIAEELDIYVVFAGFIFILFHTHRRRINKPRLISRSLLAEGLYIVIGVLIAWGISYLMKIGFAIPRPFIQFPEITPLFFYDGFAFPSGHATLFSGLAVAITLAHRKVGIFFISAALLISIARVIAGVHFPIDIVVGWILGGIISYITYIILLKKRT